MYVKQHGASVCLLTPALLRVKTIFERMRVDL